MLDLDHRVEGRRDLRTGHDPEAIRLGGVTAAARELLVTLGADAATDVLRDLGFSPSGDGRCWSGLLPEGASA